MDTTITNTQEHQTTIEKLEKRIQELEKMNEILSIKLEDKNTEIEDLEEKVASLDFEEPAQSISDLLPEHHDNLRMVGALEKILDNLDYIGVEKLEELTANSVF